MNEMQIFNSPDFGDIRTTTVDNESWFVGKDIATALGYSNASKAVMAHVDDEDKQFMMLTSSDSQNGNLVKTALINESGLYSLILSSKLPSAKKFKRWVTSDVLPTLRKTGQYKIVEAPAMSEQRVLTTDDYLKAASIVATCRNERLPYVVHYLTQGGFDAPHLADAQGKLGDPAQAIALIRDAKLIYGLNNAQIGRIVGLDRVQISMYANGQRVMGAQRAARIVELLTDALSQMQEVQ